MSGHGTKLPRRQERAVAALLTAPSIRQAADQAGVADATLRRWLRDPDFAGAYREARHGVVEAAHVALVTAVEEAVAALRRNLSCGNPGVEVRAAVAVLDQASRAQELLDIVGRVERLERAR